MQVCIREGGDGVRKLCNVQQYWISLHVLPCAYVCMSNAYHLLFLSHMQGLGLQMDTWETQKDGYETMKMD